MMALASSHAPIALPRKTKEAACARLVTPARHAVPRERCWRFVMAAGFLLTITMVAAAPDVTKADHGGGQGRIAVTVEAGSHLHAEQVNPRKPEASFSETDGDPFESFLEMHGKSYQRGTPEYAERRAIFHRRLAEIAAHNARQNRRWTAEVNRFTDQTDDELSMLRGWRHLGGTTRQEAGVGTTAPSTSLLETEGQRSKRREISMTDLSWRNLSMATRIYDQGSCGSCWAVATVSALEAHHEIAFGTGERTFSVQELVNCVPNPQHCGGKGGCDGATVELGMNWALHGGLETFSSVPYEGRDSTCQKGPLPVHRDVFRMHKNANLDDDGRTLTSPTYPRLHKMKASPHISNLASGLSFGLTGFWTLEKNKEYPLLQSLVDNGPVAVSVAAEGWFSYRKGVYDSCPQDCVVDHAVTLFGFGQTDSNRYWLIRNSWGPDWGESGFVRLIRHANEEAHCGTDSNPKLGVACEGEGSPQKVTVCGSCGVLYDSVVPRIQAGRLKATSKVVADGVRDQRPSGKLFGHGAMRRERRLRQETVDTKRIP
eukprot:TRINITY_DN25268_c0_g1_i1.p1 TRINITY_DN25268_c0_g1~~TRINITY_DN25268_c0_g1_i1.p1  ORF type:complete len:543 (-),score=65.16 TRINITY_DN25268_c0_g1_i1:79-1707(-)